MKWASLFPTLESTDVHSQDHQFRLITGQSVLLQDEFEPSPIELVLHDVGGF